MGGEQLAVGLKLDEVRDERQRDGAAGAEGGVRVGDAEEDAVLQWFDGRSALRAWAKTFVVLAIRHGGDGTSQGGTGSFTRRRYGRQRAIVLA
jgi:hypothetical protein